MTRRRPDIRKVEPPEPDSPPRSVGFLLSSLGFLTSKQFVGALEPLGIHPREWALLRFVAADEGQSQQALAERIGLPPSRMVAIVDHLEERGLVERRPDPHDRRVRALHLTAKGRKTLERAFKVALAVETELCEPLSQEERDRLIDLLQKLQAGQDVRRGVHPGLASESPEG
jgi:DNA-binding MarR family transcriptional regulator